MKITRNDVAREAGVSGTTVSFILNGKTEAYNPKTVRTVLETAKRLGYAPSKIATALKTGNSNIITVFVNDISDIDNSSILKKTVKLLYEKNFEVIVKDTSYMSVFREERSCDGIISVKSRKYLDLYLKNTFYEVPFAEINQEELCESSIEELLNKLKRIKNHPSE